MDEWIKLGDTSDFPEGCQKCDRINDTPVVIVRVEGQLYAMKDVCPHAGRPLGDGPVRGKTITCPAHGFTYRLTDGADVDDPKYGAPATVYEVREDGGTVMVNLQAPKPGSGA